MPDPVQPPPPSTPGDDSPLGRLNNSLTAVAAIVGTLGTLIATVAAMLAGGAKQQATDAKTEAGLARGEAEKAQIAVMQVARRLQTEESTYRYGKEVLDQVKANFPDFKRKPEIALAVLDLIAQAVGDENGEVRGEFKRELPVKLALYLERPLEVAAMDPNLDLAKPWVDVALAEPPLQLTAVRALVTVLRNAQADNNPDAASRAVDVLLRFRLKADENVEAAGGLGTGPNPASQAPREILATYRDILVEMSAAFTALKREGWTASGISSPGNNIAKKIALLGDAVTRIDEVDRHMPPAPAMAAGATPTPVPEATKRIVQLAQSDLTRLATETLRESDNDTSQVGQLIADLASDSADTRRVARLKLALIGQPAIAPMLAFRPPTRNPLTSPNTEADYRTRLGVATALLRMKQPIKIVDPADAQKVISLFYSTDLETRGLARDFIINLEGTETLQVFFAALKHFVETAPVPPPTEIPSDRDVTAFLNAVTAMGGWTTALKGEAKNAAGTKSIRQDAFDTIVSWKKKPLFPASPTWKDVNDRLDEMINRATSKGLTPSTP